MSEGMWIAVISGLFAVLAALVAALINKRGETRNQLASDPTEKNVNAHVNETKRSPPSGSPPPPLVAPTSSSPPRPFRIVVAGENGSSTSFPMKDWLRKHPEFLSLGTDLDKTSRQFQGILKKLGWRIEELTDEVRLYAPSLSPTEATDCERTLRQDARVQRLLNNSNWKDAAEAAITYFSRGVECTVDSWKKSATWQQVKVVFDELRTSRSAQ